MNQIISPDESVSQSDSQSEAFSPVAYLQLLRALLTRHEGINWLEWLPLSTVAAEYPERWLHAFTSLSTEDQYELLDLLRNPEAGPLADALLIILATHVNEITDEQIRQIILEENTTVQQRQVERMNFVRHRVDTLSSTVAAMRERLKEDFDSGAEALRLEQQLAELRSREYDQDERFSHIHAIEAEIIRLETRRRILERYDFEERNRYAAQLHSEIEAAHNARQELEQSIAQAMGTRDVLQKEVDQLNEQNDALQQEKTEAETIKMELQNTVSSARDEVGQLRRDQQQLQSEANTLAGQCAQLERERREIEDLSRRERVRLQELSTAAQRAGHADLAERINEIYCLLPNDKADEGFIRQPAHAGNGNQRRSS